MCMNTREYIRDENSLNYHLITVTSYELFHTAESVLCIRKNYGAFCFVLVFIYPYVYLVNAENGSKSPEKKLGMHVA